MALSKRLAIALEAIEAEHLRYVKWIEAYAAEAERMQRDAVAKAREETLQWCLDAIDEHEDPNEQGAGATRYYVEEAVRRRIAGETPGGPNGR